MGRPGRSPRMRSPREVRAEPPPDAGASAPSPGRAAAGASLRWSFAAVLGRQIPQFAAALVLARILGPDSYGVISAATVYVTLTTLILDQGLAAALIQRPTVERTLPGAVATVNLASAALLAGLTWLLAPAVATFFSAPELTPLLRVLGLGLLLKGLAVTPRAMLQRNLSFRPIGVADIGGGVLGAAAGITAAVLGAGIWSMAAQVLVTDLVIAVLLLAASRGTAPNVRLGGLRDILPFSLRIFGSNGLAYFSRNADNILIGRFLGVTSLSLYAMAYRVLVIPVQMIGQTVNRSTFPLFSRLTDQPERLARALLTTLELLAFAAVPAMALVSVAAPELVQVVLGSEWRATVPVLTVLALAGARETVCSVFGSMMRAKGAGRLIFRYEWLATGAQLAGIVIGLQFGILGVAIGLTVAGFGLMPVLLVISRRLTGVRVRTQLGRVLPPVHAAVWGALAYLAIRLLSDSPLVIMLTGASGYALVVMLVLWLAHRRALVRVVHTAREIITPAGRGSGTDPVTSSPAST
jgi:O-antigen/teichoic acid export membrane protein